MELNWDNAKIWQEQVNEKKKYTMNLNGGGIVALNSILMDHYYQLIVDFTRHIKIMVIGGKVI